MSLEKEGIKVDESFYKVISIKHLTKETFSIQLPKARFSFKPGQHISLGIYGNYQSREYSIYNGVNGNSSMIFDALEILKEKGFDRDQIHCEVYF